jgi:hypothetical protein
MPVVVTDCTRDCMVIAHAAQDFAYLALFVGVVAAAVLIFAAFLIGAAVGLRA